MPDEQDITLKDVIMHIQGVKQSLQQDVKGIQDGLKRLEEKVDEGFKKAKEHREALQEDLVATMPDTINIRRHVGMPVAMD